jgi:diguanylate cyclase
MLFSLAVTGIAFSSFDEDVLWRAMLCATIVPIFLGIPLFALLSLRVRRLAISNRRLGLVARTDSLTTCLNRGAFSKSVSSYIGDSRSLRHGAFLMIDADNFKVINDLYGHDAGDEALTMIARTIRRQVRGGDLVGRLGGEEFGVFMPDVDQRTAKFIAERIRQAIASTEFHPLEERHLLSVSIGGVAFEGHVRFSELFRIADQRLYGAKQSGRNRAIVVHFNDYPSIDLKQIA